MAGKCVKSMKRKRICFGMNGKLTRNGKDIVPWLMCGEFYRFDTGHFTVTTSDFADIIRNAKERGLPLTIDKDHSMAGPALGHAYVDTCFIETWQASPYQEPAPTLFSEVTWFDDEARKKWPYISPVIIFGAQRMATTKLGKASDKIGLVIERLSMVDNPFFTMPSINQQIQFSAHGGQPVFSNKEYNDQLDDKYIINLEGLNQVKSFNFGAIPMDELWKEILAIIQSSKSDEEKQKAIQSLVASYSRTEIERYSRSYVSLWSAIGQAAGVVFAGGTDAELQVFGANIVKAIADLKAESTSKITAFTALEQANVNANTTFKAQLATANAATIKAEGERDALKAQLDQAVFKANTDSKKHAAVGWDEQTAAVMFQHSRATYDTKMSAAPNVTAISPVINHQALAANPMGDSMSPVMPMTSQQAQAFYYNAYIQDQTTKGRAKDKGLLDEAIKYADQQMFNFNGFVNGQMAGN